MSGGHFSHRDWVIDDIASQIKNVIDNNASTEKNEWGEDKGHHFHDAVIEEFAIAVRTLRRSAVYAHRVDYLLSGDDGEDSFLQRLAEDLEALK